MTPPTLYDINQSFDVIKTESTNGITGEEETRMVLFTNFVLGEKPVIMKGSRSSGKSVVISVVSKYARNPSVLSLSSEKGHLRNKDLVNASHIIVPEINQANDQLIEMLKLWGEGASSRYSFTAPNKEIEVIEVPPKPFVTSIADENKNVNLLGEELLSRLTVVRLDSSVQQNLAVIDEKFERAANPFYKEGVSQDRVNSFIRYVHDLPSIKAFEFIYPAGTAMRTAIPPLFTDSRRDVAKYLANTYGICLFHLHDRMRKVIRGKTYLFVTPVDMWYNHVIYQNVLLDSSLKCGKVEKEILDIVRSFGNEEKLDQWKNKVKGLKVTEIHTHLLKRSFTPTIDAVKKYCDSLMETGYLVRNEESRPYRFYLNSEFDQEYDVSIDWGKIVSACKRGMKEHFPELAEEYTNRYCDDPVVIDPFTGVEKSIFSESQSTLSKDKVVNTDFLVDVDKLQDDIITLLSDDKPHSIAELHSLGSEKDVNNIIDYLKGSGDLIFPSPDKVLLLK